MLKDDFSATMGALGNWPQNSVNRLPPVFPFLGTEDGTDGWFFRLKANYDQNNPSTTHSIIYLFINWWNNALTKYWCCTAEVCGGNIFMPILRRCDQGSPQGKGGGRKNASYKSILLISTTMERPPAFRGQKSAQETSRCHLLAV